MEKVVAMAEYKIEAVSDKTREFESKYGKFISYKLKLGGEDEVVELVKKWDSPAPKKGEVLTGTIDTSGEYGAKFKVERPAFGGGRSGYQPKDEAAIKAMWSIGQAIAFSATQKTALGIEELEAVATDLYAMVDRVKAAETKEDKKEDFRDTLSDEEKESFDKAFPDDDQQELDV